mmetsp:Transcript_48369/g.59508  ORF Transcript_48369/g.59508 Transcript_48369/m.59508 type:complete len:564 (+) Transcript_48369:93-1784(+)
MAFVSVFLAVTATALTKVRDIDTIVTNSDDYHICASHELFEEQYLHDATFAHNHDTIEQHYQDTLSKGTHTHGINDPVQQIPVVVHVLFNPTRTGAANIPDSQIISQMKLVNEQMFGVDVNIPTEGPPGDFGDVLADMRFQFRLNYITRTQTSSNGFSSNNNIKFSGNGGKSCELCSTNMNFWIGELSGGLIGYAQFPGGNVNTDGIVMTTRAIGDRADMQSDWGSLFLDIFGNNQFSHVTTHEIGHWINLRHIWGDTSSCNRLADFVQDTPGASGPNRGCPNYPRITCTDPEMSMNYMDYTDSRCSYMFSEGQKVRAKAVFDTSSRDQYIEAVYDTRDEFISYIYMVSTETEATESPCFSNDDVWVNTNIHSDNGYTYACLQKTNDIRLKGITDIKMVKTESECKSFGNNYYYSLDNNNDLHFCWNKEFVTDVSQVITNIIFANPLVYRNGYTFDNDVLSIKLGLKLGYKKQEMIIHSKINDNTTPLGSTPSIEGANATNTGNNTTVITMGIALIMVAILFIGFIARFYKKRKQVNASLKNENLMYGTNKFDGNTTELSDRA